MRSPPKDKLNRVIFTIYCHLKEKTGGPNWSAFLELLLSAGALKRDIKKERSGKEVATDNPDRRISTHLKSFQKYHPSEAQAIEWIMAKPVFPPAP